MEHMPGCTIEDVQAARPHVYRHLQPTPLYRYGGLSDLLGADVHVKHENHQPTGAFKVRGGVNLAASLTAAPNTRLYTASTGNHGQSIAFGGQVTGTPVCIALPQGANPTKAAAIRSLGAEVIFHGRDFDEAREWIRVRAATENGRFIGPTDPELIAGVGTYTLEIMESLPAADVIFVPVGAGSGAASCALVAKTIKPEIRIIAVQAECAPTIQRSWVAGHPLEGTMNTDAEGLATRVAFENTLRMMRDPVTGIDDFILVSEAAMREATRLHLEHTHNVAELAGAATLAGALQLKSCYSGSRMVLVMSGGNLAMSKLRSIVGEGYDRQPSTASNSGA